MDLCLCQPLLEALNDINLLYRPAASLMQADVYSGQQTGKMKRQAESKEQEIPESES